MFKYELIWSKNKATGHLDCKRKPLKAHENILIFYKSLGVYNPQMRKGKMHKRGSKKSAATPLWGDFANRTLTESDEYYPQSILEFPTDHVRYHPTQKPVALLEYLIKTYTDESMTILDNCMGSGSTGIAAIDTGRNFIGIELDKAYFDIASGRISTLLDSVGVPSDRILKDTPTND